MIEFLEPFANYFDDPTTAKFVFAILVIFIFSFVFLPIRAFAAWGFAQRVVAGAPSILTTVGVLGTFTGIFLGLINFDVENIDDSVPQLLVGLKFAFVTSIAGMSAAIAFRMFRGVFPSRGGASTGRTVDDLYDVLADIRTHEEDQSSSIVGALNEVKKAISSEGDASLVTQMQKLRTTTQDGQRELIEEFRTFAKTMAENNQKALIEALKEVIQDFNKNLTEQFGENFKQLNKAVGALLVWQENYKIHIERVESDLAAATLAVSACAGSLGEVQKHSEAIPELIEKLDPAIAAACGQIEELSAHLGAIAALKDQALEAFPTIEENLKKVTEDLSELVKDIVTDIGEAVEEQQAQGTLLTAQYETLRRKLNEAQNSFSAAIEKAMSEMNDQMRQAFERQSEVMQTTAKDTQRQIADAWSQTEEAVNQRISDLDDEMSKELTRSLNLMGQHLASISEKFASDYTPLAERLREVVLIAGRDA